MLYICVACMCSVYVVSELIEVSTVLRGQLRTCSKLSGMCGDMCDVLYDVMLYCNVVQSFVVERHNRRPQSWAAAVARCTS